MTGAFNVASVRENRATSFSSLLGVWQDPRSLHRYQHVRPEAIPGMAARAEAIRAEGAVAACQLVHLGRETTGAEMWFPPVAPSAVRSPREPVRPRPLTEDEIEIKRIERLVRRDDERDRVADRLLRV